MSKSPLRPFYDALLANMPVTPTDDQSEALRQLTRYCLSPEDMRAFLLKGYAGTGKTTLIRTLVESLPKIQRKAVLLAPTGRAAKVMSQYSSRTAHTIHRYIYQPQKDRNGNTSFRRRSNRSGFTVYIVDEASMIADATGEFSEGLLHDLLAFVREGRHCRLILVGDEAQLPPVKSDRSPALDGDYLMRCYGWSSREVVLRQVMRQEQGSVLLDNATALRELQQHEPYSLPQITTGPDVIRLIEGFDVEEALNDAFAEAGREGTAVIVRSNKRAGMFNQQIRQQVLWQEDEISAGDFLMVVKNNYFWLPAEHQAGFIANGDIVEILRIYDYEEFYGHRFARVQLRMVDYPGAAPIDVHIMLDVLSMPSASLSREEGRKFYQEVLEDYQDLPRAQQHQELRQNPYFNALQVKFAYVFTCHKAQGGQWSQVFIEKPWLPDEEISLDYLRWLYTAFTRASDKVFLINFDPEYFGEERL